MEFNVASETGSYYTWALATALPTDSMEVDVRACKATAQALKEKAVLITGRLIARDERHLPLLVAERIVPVDERGNELPAIETHVACAPEPDPVTGQFDPTQDFYIPRSEVRLAAR